MRTSTHAELEGARAELEAMRKEGGWTFLPADEPERGSLGVTAFRPGPDGTEEQTRVEWLPFGELTPEMHVAKDAREFEAMLDQLRKEGMMPTMRHARAPAVFACDDPVKRMVGFVAYSGGKAVVVRAPMTVTKEGSPELKAELAALAHLRTNLLVPRGWDVPTP